MTDESSVGFVGLGGMGSGMAKLLLERGGIALDSPLPPSPCSFSSCKSVNVTDAPTSRPAMAGHMADHLKSGGRGLTVHNRTKAKAEKLLERTNVEWCVSKTTAMAIIYSGSSQSLRMHVLRLVARTTSYLSCHHLLLHTA